MRSVGLAATLLLVAGCGQEPVVRDERHGYLLVESTSTDQGWVVIDALNARLPALDRERIRTAAPIGAGPAMFVDFTGDCAANRVFVAAAERIALAEGARALRCTGTPPG